MVAAPPLSPAALIGLLTFALVCASRQVLNDGDTFTHIAAGEWMLQHGAVLRWDPFSWTFAGQPWAAHEWLAEVVLALAYRGGGLTGVVLLTAATAAAALGLLAREIGRWCGGWGTLGLVAGALLCAAPTLLARPHVLALPCVAVWASGLVAARERGGGPGWWLLGVMAVWANLHGGFAFGIALAGALAIEATLARAAAARWWVLVAGAVGAAMLTPQGWRGLLFPWRLVRLESLGVIPEWQPLTFPEAPGFELVLLALVALLGTGRVRVAPFRLLLLLGLLHSGLAHSRHIVLFGVVGALLLAGPVGRAFAAARPRVAGRGTLLCWSGVAAAALLRIAHPIGAAESAAAPVAALAAVPAGVAEGRVLNSSLFGGYLALAGVRPFIDGRAELFGDGFIGEYVALSTGDEAGLRRGVELYGFDWAILAAGDPLVGRFDRLSGWRRGYADAVAVVFVRG